MNRTYIYNRLLGLLLWLLVAVGARAQSVEYWFDNNVNPKPLPISGGKADISTKGLKAGVHTLHLRAYNGGGYDDYSPIYSSTFLKFEALGSSEIQYWFDGNVENFASMPISTETETLQLVDLKMEDNDRFPLGLHQLSMRIADASGIYSPVYNTLVMRMPAGTEGSVLEYWFDDDRSNPGTIPVDVKSGASQTLALDLSNLENFPYGFHKLNMRVAAYGNQYSPVYSSFVMRLPTGPNNYLVYWLDDDYDPNNLKKIRANSQNGLDATFETDINLSSASSGMHRLHYRVSRNAVDYGPVHEVPILVTRKYNHDAEVTLLSQYFWLDDAKPTSKEIPNNPTIFTQTYILAPEHYSVGQHAFHVQYKNSADVFSEENITYFYKETANGRLVAGIMPDGGSTGIDGVSQTEKVLCVCDNGTIYLDCQSPKLGKTGVVTICDMMGRVIAQQNVSNDDGIRAAINVENHTRQLVIVRLMSGDVHFSKKLVIR